MSKMPRYRIIFALFIGLVGLSAQDINEAIRLFNASHFEQARGIFRQVVQNKDDPRIAEAYYYLGRLSIAPDSALFYYSKVTNDYPQSRYGDIAYLEIAKIHIAREKYNNAIIALNELMRKFPDTEYQDEIMFWLGYSYINSGKQEEGKSILENLKKEYPKSLWSDRASVIIPAKGTPVTSEQYYTIQAGSYRNKSNADNYADEIRTKGYEVDVVEALVKGTTYYRVWVGRFSSIAQAKTFSQELESLGIKGNVVKGY